MWEVRGWDFNGGDSELRREPDGNGTTVVTARHPKTAVCRHVGTGVVVRLEGRLITVIEVTDNNPHDARLRPQRFEPIALHVPLDGAVPSTAVIKQLGLGGLYKLVERELMHEHHSAPEFFAEPALLPRPGRRGYPIADYAQLVELYLDAVNTHGQRYMAGLQQRLQSTRWRLTPPKTIVRQLERAGTRHGGLGLLDRTGWPKGKAGGVMTDKCKTILADLSNAAGQA